MRRFWVALSVVGVGVVGATAAGAGHSPASVRVQHAIDFGTKRVGGTYYDRVTITNTSGRPLGVLVDGGLPDDFGFGFMPGSTCPVLTPGAVMAPKERCVAVVRFSPTAGFVGWKQVGSLQVITTDPVSGVATTTPVPVVGTGRL